MKLMNLNLAAVQYCCRIHGINMLSNVILDATIICLTDSDMRRGTECMLLVFALTFGQINNRPIKSGIKLLIHSITSTAQHLWWVKLIINTGIIACPIKCGVKLPIHSQISTVASLKLGNFNPQFIMGVITYPFCWLKLNHVSQTAPDIWHKKRFLSFTGGRPQPTIENVTFMMPSLFAWGNSHMTCKVPIVPVAPAGVVNIQAYFDSKWLMLYDEDIGCVYLQVLTKIWA